MPALSADTLRPAALRAAGFSLLWWVLVEGDPRSIWLGGLVVAAAVVASLRAWPPRRAPPSPAAVAAFAAYFVWESLRSGVAVAALALRPRLHLEPELRRVPLRLPPGPGRVLLADTVSLLPGTLATGLEDDVLVVHVLDRRLVTDAELDAAQDMVARLTGAA